MRLSPLAGATLLSLAATLLGCSANVSASSEIVDAEASTSTSAIIVVEKTSGVDGARGEAVARFLRMRTRTGDEALRVVGATIDLPAPGSCSSIASLSVPKAKDGADVAAVQLMDVGVVSMEANGVKTHLPARRLPDVVDLVSGVVYAEATEPEQLPARTGYTLNVSGAPALDLPAFIASGQAPGEPTDIHVQGRELTGAQLALGPGAPIDLSWAPEGAEDVVYVDVAGRELTTTIRCAFADAGHGTVPAAAIQGIEDGTLTLHRLHRERFRARGIDSGEMRFDFARALSFSRR